MFTVSVEESCICAVEEPEKMFAIQRWKRTWKRLSWHQTQLKLYIWNVDLIFFLGEERDAEIATKQGEIEMLLRDDCNCCEFWRVGGNVCAEQVAVRRNREDRKIIEVCVERSLRCREFHLEGGVASSRNYRFLLLYNSKRMTYNEEYNIELSQSLIIVGSGQVRFGSGLIHESYSYCSPVINRTECVYNFTNIADLADQLVRLCIARK